VNDPTGLRPYVCIRCGATHEADAVRWRCDCGGWLDLPPPGSGAQPEPVHLGEGRTPVVPVRIGGRTVQAKLEFLGPTLSFKDRGAAVLVGLARAVGARRLVADSSGNAGTALAAYAARAGLAIEVFVAASTAPAKLAQAVAHGADVVTVAGDREAVAAQAIARVEDTGAFYASHVYNPWFWEGTKHVVTELAGTARTGLPSVLVLPAGNGTLVLGAHRALRELDLLDRCRIVAVQAERCAPIARADAAGVDDVEPVTNDGTVAEGIAIAAPARGAEVLAAVRRTGGRVVTVTDDEAATVGDELARQGLFVEPTAAAAAAGVLRLTDDEAADAAVPLCGAGLKGVSRARRATPASARRGTG
jgi:threonine synthase